MKIVSSKRIVMEKFSHWQDALLQKAVSRGARKWKVSGAAIYVRLEQSRRKEKPVLNTSLTRSELFDSFVVKINMPNDPKTSNGLSAVGQDDDGAFWMLRQGHLQKNAISDSIRGFEFARFGGVEPALTTKAHGEKVSRYWFKVCQLDANSSNIQRETSRFVEVCLLARYRKAIDSTGDDSAISSRPEGRLVFLQHFSRERNKGLVKEKKAAFLKTHGVLRCEACDFVFSERYGSYGDGIIDVHHNRKPIGMYDGIEYTSTDDLALICCNCHRIAHSVPDWLTVSEVRTLLLR